MSTYNKIPSRKVIDETIKKMNERGFNAEFVSSSAEALKRLKEVIPAKAEVIAGTSTTLNQIGFTELLDSGEAGWQNLNAQVRSEDDERKRADVRRFATTAEYAVASANAVTEEGQIVAVDATGSRVGTFHFSAEHLILVIGAQKIMPDLESAMQRIREHVFPLEDERARKAYGMGSGLNKWVILEREVNPSRVSVLIVAEQLGF